MPRAAANPTNPLHRAAAQGKTPAEPIPALGEMPADGVLPGADPAEKAGIAEIRKHVTEENNAAADDWLVSRFYRGYTVRSWAHAPDRIERTAQLVNFTCDQRRLWKHDELRKKTLPRTDAWNEQWPQSYPGNDAEGRSIWYMLLPQDFMKEFSQPDAQEHHVQDMLRLEKIKRNNNEALKAAGRTERSHHVLICDISHEKVPSLHACVRTCACVRAWACMGVRGVVACGLKVFPHPAVPPHRPTPASPRTSAVPRRRVQCGRAPHAQNSAAGRTHATPTHPLF